MYQIQTGEKNVEYLKDVLWIFKCKPLVII